MFLSDYVAAVRAIADVEAFGVVLGRPEERAQLVTRHRAGVAAHLLPLESLPAALRSVTVARTVITPLQDETEASHPMFDRLMGYGIECLLLTPLPDRQGLFWTGKHGVEPFADTEIAAFESLAAGVAAAIEEPEPRAARLARLARIDAVEQMLPLIAGALDVREVFHRLSGVARSVLPHDAATIQILSDDHTHARLYALDGLPEENATGMFSTNYAAVFNRHFQFSLHDDLQASPAERDRPAARAGLRSGLRLPLRFDGQIGGTLEFNASAVAAFRERDVDVARRITEYVTLALAHQRIADEAGRAAALRERADNLVMLD